jgi:hypothetical protein
LNGDPKSDQHSGGFTAELAAVLANAGLRPTLSASRVFKSAIYDPGYRLCLIALSFQILAKEQEDKRFLNTTILKLAQFVAARPTLLPTLESWLSSEKEQPEPLSWYVNMMPRGFKQDGLHDRIVEYLLVTRELSESGKNLVWCNAPVLTRAWSCIYDQELFTTERRVVARLKALRLTLKSVGG